MKGTRPDDWTAIIDDAAYEINQRWGEPVGDDEFAPIDEKLVRETAEAILTPFAENPFQLLTADQRQLLVCALAGNHPPKLAHLRMDVLRDLARADREAKEAAARAL